jgi:hypothetical protein
LSIVLAGGLLVALAIPALQMKSVTSDVDELPQGPARDRDLQQGQRGVPDRRRHGDSGGRGRRKRAAREAVACERDVALARAG